MSTTILLPAQSNQARGLAEYAIDFVSGRFPPPDSAVRERVALFHLDSIACAAAALGIQAAAPKILREEALAYAVSEDRPGARCLRSRVRVASEKAVAANCSAVRELDANGTNFGYCAGNKQRQAGEFGHNDFYPVCVAGAQVANRDGATLERAMLCVDEIRGRLAEVFSLKTYKLDHVLHGAIASAAVYGALVGATATQIESAIGMVVAHHVPFRAIRHGEQLSDSKGASAAISAEAAVLCVHRAMRGFIGPGDIFRNPQAVFCLFGKAKGAHASPFDLSLATHGDDFAVMGMHFKLGLYEHQSAGAIQGLIDLLDGCPALLKFPDEIERVKIAIYEPAYSIIGDPAKRDTRTRQSADHSLPYIAATILRKAIVTGRTGWRALMLEPADYELSALHDTLTRRWMRKIEFKHGGPKFDAAYPDGIPTTVEIHHERLGRMSSGLVKYPAGHARSPQRDWRAFLDHKVDRLLTLGGVDPAATRARLERVAEQSSSEVQSLYLI